MKRNLFILEYRVKLSLYSKVCCIYNNVESSLMHLNDKNAPHVYDLIGEKMSK